MNYLQTIPGYLDSGCKVITGQIDHFCPTLRSQISSNAGRCWSVIKDFALAHPLVTIASSNLVLLLCARKITDALKSILNYIRCPSQLQNVIVTATAFSMLVAANAGLHLALSTPIPIVCGVALATTAVFVSAMRMTCQTKKSTE